MTEPIAAPPAAPAAPAAVDPVARFDTPDYRTKGDRDLRAAFAAYVKSEPVSISERARISAAQNKAGFLETLTAGPPLSPGARYVAELLAPSIATSGLADAPVGAIEEHAKILDAAGRSDLAAEVRAASAKEIGGHARATFAAAEKARAGTVDANLLSHGDWQKMKRSMGL